MRLTHRTAGVAALALAGAVTGCNSDALLRVTDQDVVRPSAVSDSSSLPVFLAGALLVLGAAIVALHRTSSTNDTQDTTVATTGATTTVARPQEGTPLRVYHVRDGRERRARRRHGEVLQHRQRDRIQTTGRNPIVRERIADKL